MIRYLATGVAGRIVSRDCAACHEYRCVTRTIRTGVYRKARIEIQVVDPAVATGRARIRGGDVAGEYQRRVGQPHIDIHALTAVRQVHIPAFGIILAVSCTALANQPARLLTGGISRCFQFHLLELTLSLIHI